MSDWKWYYDDTPTDIPQGGSLLENRMERQPRGSMSASVLVSPIASTIAFFTPAGEPRNANWRAGEVATVNLRVLNGNSAVQLGAVVLYQVRAGVIGDIFATTGILFGYALTTGLHTFELTTQVIAPPPVAADRFAVAFIVAASVPSTITLGLGTGQDKVVVPIAKPAGVFFGVPEPEPMYTPIVDPEPSS